MGCLKKQSGMTLTEVLLALAVLSIVSIPLLTSFMNSIAINKKTDKMMQMTIIERAVKNNVTEYAKYGTEGIYYFNDPFVTPTTISGKKFRDSSDNLISVTNAAIQDAWGEPINTDYMYAAILTFNGLPVSTTFTHTYRYEVSIQDRRTSKVLKKLFLDVNLLNSRY